MLCDDLSGKEIQKEMRYIYIYIYVYIFMTDSLSCKAETNTIL